MRRLPAVPVLKGCEPQLLIFLTFAHAKSLLDEIPQPSVEKIKEYMEGNICRCTGYRKILEAILDAAGKTPGQTG